MIAHLEARAAGLADLGWKGRDAEWLALVCLHSGAFLRSQYLAFRGGEVHRQAATRFVQQCGNALVEEPWMGSRERLCRVVWRPLYRALRVEHIRHRRSASPSVMLRRVLSLDYVLEHADEPWLATEDEKVAGLSAAGVPAEAMPRREYGAAEGARNQRRYFVHKLPVAYAGDAARFVYVQPAWDVSHEGLRSWGESNELVWSALGSAGISVTVVVVGVDPVRLAAARKVLASWVDPADPVNGDWAGELARLQVALKDGDAEALDSVGGFDAGLARMVELQRLVAEPQAEAAQGPRIAVGETWRSVRVAE